MEIEIWKPIPDYEGLYEASSLGRIRTCDGKTTYTQIHGIRKWKQRILKTRGNNYSTGYRVALWKDGKPKDFLIARLVASAFYGKSNLTVNHIDGNRFNNRVENLEWCSLKENIQKAFDTGLYGFQKPIKVTNKTTGEQIVYRSQVLASKSINRNSGYLSEKIKKGIYENSNYKWERVNNS